ncbi:Brp/Blh family beta-carotene 15,15'-dioxygenase [Pelagibacterales bacterium SAG-MED07]|nr:Brp/Blh family beta-carotene 15,15'-dioxygenase [Pelagibacterales bacterium SAG-MED07]
MKILDKHTIVTQLASLIVGLFIYISFNVVEANNFTNLICFFLIITFGISHGALDNLKGKKLINYFGYRNIIIFYLSYILISLFVILLWIIFPTLTLSVFLLVACYHFGKEDTAFLLEKNKFYKSIRVNDFVYFSKGLLIIFAPLYFHNEETLSIFKLLGADSLFLLKFQNDLMWEYHKILGWISFIGYIIFLLINFRDGGYKAAHCFDFIPIIILNTVLTPLLAFTVYFCFIHSFKHSVSLIYLLDNKNFQNGIKKFLKKALPLTFITAILFILSVYILTNYYVLDDAILKVIFIGLASLTFPHILLEYLIEKNEK